MKFSFPRFFLFATITVVGTVSVAAEPCASNDGNWGQYDMTACNTCAQHGNKLGGQCCDAIYRHSLGRDDDWLKEDVSDDCVKEGKSCAGDVKEGVCAPGLTCTRNCSVEPTSHFWGKDVYGKYTCETQPYPPCENDDQTETSALVLQESSATRNADEGGGPSFGVVVVGLLGAALMVKKVVTSRHSRGVALRRHQYSAVDAPTTTTPLSV